MLDHALLSLAPVDGGVLRTSDLLARGVRRAQIEAGIRTGQLFRVRRGWFAVPGAQPDAVRAVQAQASLTCVSALRLHGIWVPVTSGLHVRQRRPGRQAPLPAGMVTCHPGIAVGQERAIDPARVAWRAALRCLPLAEAVAVTDSALRCGAVTGVDIADLPGAHRRVGELVDPRAQSGTESMVRVRLRQLRIGVTPQVPIPGVGIVDLVVGDRLVIECDSAQHHTSRDAYHNDRRRDVVLTLLGYRSMRLTWERVMFDWDAVLQDILAFVRSDRHRGRPVPVR